MARLDSINKELFLVNTLQQLLTRYVICVVRTEFSVNSTVKVSYEYIAKFSLCLYNDVYVWFLLSINVHWYYNNKHLMGCEPQMSWTCLITPAFFSVRLTWLLAWDQGSLVGLCMQDYKSTCALVTIVPPWLTSRYTSTQTAFRPAYSQKLNQLT